jgi:predicted dehydrogenase
VGLQARVSPALAHMRHLIAGGHIGAVTACRVHLMREGVLERPSSRSWQRDASLGANTLTIPNGHTIDALRFVAGEFSHVACVVSTQVHAWRETDTGRTVEVTSPDNVLVSGRLAGGGVASLHVATVQWAGSGYRMEIYGSEGTLVATGADSPQLCDVQLLGARGAHALAPVALPSERAAPPPRSAPREPRNVFHMYRGFAAAIRTGRNPLPGFDTAVQLHRLIDAIAASSRKAARWRSPRACRWSRRRPVRRTTRRC